MPGRNEEMPAAGVSRWRIVAAVAALVLVLFVVACGDDDEDSSASSGSQEPAGDIVATAQERVEELSAPVEEWEEPPASPAPKENQKIFMISVDQRAEGAVRVSEGVEEADDILGWETVVVDAQSAPDKMAAGVNRAVNEGADGIVMLSIGEEFVSEGLQRASEADIPVVSILSGNEVKENGVGAEVGRGFEYNKGLGEAAAWYAIASEEGNVNAVILEDSSAPTARATTDKFAEVIERCPDCTVDSVVKFGIGDLTDRLSELTRTAVSRSPDVNWVFAPFDAAATFAVEGVRTSGADVKVGGTGGNRSNLALISKGDIQAVTVGQPMEWLGFAAVDEVNRLMNGEEPVNPTFPLRLLTVDNVEGDEPWTGDIDYAARYSKLWGK